ncbi:hypothetical protein J6590_075519 [Homalodisca vitripennis]|nr:hypothetical protein J6590_075519 [Homalodisca vitripennis]
MVRRRLRLNHAMRDKATPSHHCDAPMSFKLDQDRVREMLDLPYSELGEPESDYSDVNDVDLGSNAENNTDSEECFGVQAPIPMDVDQELNNDEPIAGPSHQVEAMDLSQHHNLDPTWKNQKTKHRNTASRAKKSS